MIALIIAATIASMFAVFYLDHANDAFKAGKKPETMTKGEMVALTLAIILTIALIIVTMALATILSATIVTYAAALFAGVAISKTVAVIAGAAIVINRLVFNVRRDRRIKRLEAAIEVKA